MNTIANHRDEWRAARIALLKREKAATRMLDELARQRSLLPWVLIDKDYSFDSQLGRQSLAELFGGNSQLVIYHFMFAPEQSEGCRSCSFVVDHLARANVHLINHDVTLVIVSRTPLAQIEPFKRRMNWQLPWVSSHDTDFNSDFGVSFTPDELAKGANEYNYRDTDKLGDEMPGLSVFAKDDSGKVYHTYSTYARGLDILMGANQILDLTPKGRNEQGPMSWVRHHDTYDHQSLPTARQCCTNKGGP